MLTLRPKSAVFSTFCYRSLPMRAANKRCALSVAIAFAFGCVGAARGEDAALHLVADGGFEKCANGRLSDKAEPGGWKFLPPAYYNPAAQATVIEREGRNGTKCVKLSGGSAMQTVAKLNAGIYELTAWARGKGRIVLSDGPTKRDMALGADWHQYSFVFAKQVAGPADIVISVSDAADEAWADDVELKPADAALTEAWKKQEAALVQLGYLPDQLSAQRPAPDVGGQAQAGPAHPLPKATTEAIVFADDHYDAVWVEQPELIIEYLAGRGFRKLSAEEIGAWMADKVKNQNAYGTVCVFPSGMLPDSVLGPETLNARTELNRPVRLPSRPAAQVHGSGRSGGLDGGHYL